MIHDPDVTMSAATMHVNVGFMADPPHMPGMAHLLEHALFLGTTEYQDLHCFDYLLKMWGGSSNASTYPFETTYQFEVMHDALAETLKMFASMFICPLLNDRMIMEVMNVDHEARHFPNMLTRLQAITTGTDPCGTAETLLKIPLSRVMDFKMEVQKFFKENYSSNIMTLVVISRENLEELSKIVNPLFSRMKNNKVPFLSQRSGKDMVKMQREIRILDWKNNAPNVHILWAIDNSSQALSLFTFMIIRLWLLENVQANICNLDKNCFSKLNIYIDKYRYVQGRHIVFCLGFDVTTDGLKKRNEIITRVYQCINKLKTEGMDEDIYNCLCETQQKNVLDCCAEDATSLVAALARDATCLNTSTAGIIESELLGSKDRIDLIRSYADKLSPYNSEVVVAYNNPSEIKGGISHQIDELPTLKLEHWNNARISESIRKSRPWEDAVNYSGILFPPDICLKLEYSSNQMFKNSSVHDECVALFCHLIEVPFFSLVRTEHQTGYSVSVDPTPCGFCVQIVYDGADKATLQIKLAAYMLRMHTYLEDLSEEIFAKHVAALAYTFETAGEAQRSSLVRSISKKDICLYAKKSKPNFD